MSAESRLNNRLQLQVRIVRGYAETIGSNSLGIVVEM